LTHTLTLSQSFDIGDFIAPDILSVVDASVRAAADNILERDGLVEDIGRIIDLRTDTPYIADALLGGLVPSMDPNVFLPYEKPKAPVMAGFEDFETAEIVLDEPQAETEFEAEPLPDLEDEAGMPAAAEIDRVDVDVKIPDLGNIEQTAALVQDGIVIDIPEVSRYNANLFKVKMDTLRFDEKFKTRMRLIIIAIVAVIEALLIIYLLTG